jgi:hypothetical protein
MGALTLHEVVGAIDIAVIARTEPTLVNLRRRMMDDFGWSDARATRVTESIIGRALLRYGEHVISGKSEVLDRIVALRNELDDAYDAAFSYGGTSSPAAARAALETRLRNIDRLLTELDDEMTKLGEPMYRPEPPPGAGDTLAPLHAEIAGIAPTRALTDADRRMIDEDILKGRDRRGRRSRTPRLEGGRYRFTRNADGSYTKTFEDGATAVFHIENGRTYRVETFGPPDGKVSTGVIRENDVLTTPYGRLPRLTALVQANHGYQNSTMTALFGRPPHNNFGYDGNAVPTIAMRNSRRGSPHGLVTNAQNAAKGARNAPGTTLLDIRRWTIGDLKMAGVPDHQIAAYLTAMDDYFVQNVLPNIPAARRPDLLGPGLTTWPPPVSMGVNP